MKLATESVWDKRLSDVRNERTWAYFRQVIILDRNRGDFLFELFLKRLSTSNAFLSGSFGDKITLSSLA